MAEAQKSVHRACWPSISTDNYGGLTGDLSPARLINGKLLDRCQGFRYCLGIRVDTFGFRAAVEEIGDVAMPFSASLSDTNRPVYCDSLVELVDWRRALS